MGIRLFLSDHLRKLRNIKNDLLVILKSGRGRLRERSLTTAFNYRVRVTIQTRTDNGVRNWVELVAYKTGRKESFHSTF